jgi:alpha-L-rhamnosidase
MVRYLDYLEQISDNYILPQGWIGDWGSAVEGWEEGEPVSTPTAYYFYNATILKKAAQVLDKSEDKMRFEILSKEIKNAYNQHFFDSLTNNYNDGSQMANAFPLYLGLVEEKNESAVLDNLVNDIVEKNDTHLTTGVLGTKYLIEALSMHGRSDVAWALATQTTYPSWAEMMKRFNTMCEFWTLKQSHNHVMMGSIDAWFYKVLAGIQIDESQPAFKEFKVQPFLANGLDYVSATTNTLRGEISVNWEKTGSKFTMGVSVPFNTSATVYVPGSADNLLYVNGHELERVPSIELLGYSDGCNVFRVPSGEWNFITQKP